MKEDRTLKTEMTEKAKQIVQQTKEKQKSDEQYMKEFVESKENQQRAHSLAEQVIDVVSKNWFTLEKMAKKTGEDQPSCSSKLAILSKFGLCAARRGVDKRNGNNIVVPEYKITLSPQIAIDAIDQQINQLDIQIKVLQNKREQMSKRLTKKTV